MGTEESKATGMEHVLPFLQAPVSLTQTLVALLGHPDWRNTLREDLVCHVPEEKPICKREALNGNA